MRFDYLQPHDLAEAISFLEREASSPLAGGTDLIPRIKDKLVSPKSLVNIKGLGELQGVRMKNGSRRIGALTTIRTLETSPAIRHEYPLIAQAAAVLGSVQIRNLATLGGNLCHAVPSAEMATPLLALNAQVSITGPRGKRTMPLESFFLGPRQTVLKSDELLCEVLLPALPERWGGAYLKLEHRSAMDLALVGVSAFIALDSKGRCGDCRIALGAVAPTPMRSKQAEQILRGKEITEATVAQAGEVSMRESKPIDDHRASASYRRKMVNVLTRRALTQAFAMARGKGA
jgi:carbon-monoxide dehydrogenase medium subunit